jgi:hypothetical protein
MDDGLQDDPPPHPDYNVQFQHEDEKLDEGGDGDVSDANDHASMDRFYTLFVSIAQLRCDE